MNVFKLIKKKYELQTNLKGIEYINALENEVENLNLVINSKDNYIEKLQTEIEQLKKDKEWIYETFADM